jgi:ADP-ribose pyrophosphatase YjhB (NUDIX family)
VTGNDPPLAERVGRDLDRRLDRLRERFGDVPVVEETVENDSDRFERGRDTAAEGWRGDAGAFVTDSAGRALFVRHEGAPDAWGVPGGGHEPGESFARTARREVREETDVEVWLTDVWLARRRTFVHAEVPDRRLEMLTVWFDARPAECPAAPSATGDDAVLEARWFDEPPETVPDVLAERVARWDR